MLELDISIRRHVAVFAVISLASVSLLTLVGTGIFIHVWRAFGETWKSLPWYYKLLKQSNLAIEDVVAVWFSSMLLLIVAVTAVVCFFADAERYPHSIWNVGWLGISLTFSGLSFDELGSVHERLVLPNGWIGEAIWLAPVMFVIPVYMLLFGWMRMRREKMVLLLLAFGVAMFMTVPIQESIEASSPGFTPSGHFDRPISSILLEEGTELTGMLSVLAALCLHLIRLPTRAKERITVRIRMPFQRLWGCYLLLLLGSAAGIYLSSRLLIPDGTSGTPQNWFPSMLALVASFLSLALVFRCNVSGHANGWLMFALVQLTLSAFVGGNLHGVEGMTHRVAMAAVLLVGWGGAVPLAHAKAGAALLCGWAMLAAPALVFCPAKALPILLVAATASALRALLLELSDVAEKPGLSPSTGRRPAR